MFKTKTKMRIIYLPYEIYTREVFGYLFLAEKLVRHGYVDRVIIGNKLVLGFLAKIGFLPSGVWFLKSAQIYIFNFLKLLKKRGFSIILQDIEAVSTFDKGKKIDTFMKPKLCREMCDVILTNTQSEHDGLIEDGESNKLSLVGSLRFYSFFDHRFKSSINKKRERKRILFISSDFMASILADL